MDEFEKKKKYQNNIFLINIGLILKVFLFDKVCQIWCQNSNLCYFQNQIKEDIDQ